jgi:hypothetical protein
MLMTNNYSQNKEVKNTQVQNLLKIARPDIYRNNAFRILEVSTTNTMREISSKMRKLELMEKLENTNQNGRGFLFLSPSPNIDTRREAYQRINDPESRLVDEILWFWPISNIHSTDTSAIDKAMNNNDIARVITIWKQHESQSSESNISLHNLAVLYHTLALDLELMVTKETLSKKHIELKKTYWEQALQRWQNLLKHEEFWQKVNKRVTEFDDPRLTTGTISRIREQLPLIILSINAMLASQAAQKGDLNEATYHVRLIQNSKFSSEIISDALRNALSPIRERIKLICMNTEIETNKSPEHADLAIKNLLSQTSQFLVTIDVLLPDSHPAKESTHDQIAAQILSSAISYGNKCDNWNKALEMLQKALHIAISEQLRQRIRTNIEIDSRNLELSLCWFCQKNPSEEQAAIGVQMYGDVHNDGSKITWRYFTVTVPRCHVCKSSHSSRTMVGWLSTLIGIVIAVLIGMNGNGWVGFLAFVICFVAGLVIGPLVIPKGIKPEKHKGKFPAIQRLIAQGWNVGAKPPQAN